MLFFQLSVPNASQRENLLGHTQADQHSEISSTSTHAPSMTQSPSGSNQGHSNRPTSYRQSEQRGRRTGNYLERLFSEEYIRNLLDPVVRDIVNRAVPPQSPQPFYRPRPDTSANSRQHQERQVSSHSSLSQQQMLNANNIVCDNQCNCQHHQPSSMPDVLPVSVIVPSPVMYVQEIYQQQQPPAPTLNVFLPQYGIVNFTSRNAHDDDSVVVNSSDTESAFSGDDYEDERDVRQQSFVEHPLNFALSRPTGVDYNFRIDYNAQNANLHLQSTRF